MIYNDLMLFMQFISILQDLCLLFHVLFILKLFLPYTVQFRYELYIHITNIM